MVRTWDFVKAKRKPKKKKPKNKSALYMLCWFIFGLLVVSYDIASGHIGWLTYISVFATAGHGILWAHHSRPRNGKQDDDDDMNMT